MITRPLDLASRLRPINRGWEALSYVNVGALALFFFVFGSRFVLAPGMAVDFALPEASRGATSAWMTDVVIAVPASGQAVVGGAVLDFPALGVWLKERALEDEANGVGDVQAGGARGGKRLLVQASAALPARDLATIYALAAEAGFAGVLVATAESGATGTGGVGAIGVGGAH